MSNFQSNDNSNADDGSSNVGNRAIDRRVLDEIVRTLAGLRFGSLEITVHDGRVTQIECKRKIRMT